MMLTPYIKFGDQSELMVNEMIRATCSALLYLICVAAVPAQSQTMKELWDKHGAKFQEQRNISTNSSASKDQVFNSRTGCNFLSADIIDIPQKKREELVKWVQNFLATLNYTVKIDGKLDKETCNALRAFQRAEGLIANGVLDDATVAAMDQIADGFETSKPKVAEKKPDTKPEVGGKVVVVREPSPPKKYQVGSGTGFYISEEGYLVTNHHVIEDCEDLKVQVASATTSKKAIIVASDKQNDLAILQTKDYSGYSFPLKNRDVQMLDDVLVSGFPFGDTVSSALKSTKGMVSAEVGLGDNYSEFQMTAAIQSGNSGGPVMDNELHIMGIATYSLDKEKMFKEEGKIPENMNFAVKSSVLKNILKAKNISFKETWSPEEIKVSRRDRLFNSIAFVGCWMSKKQFEMVMARDKEQAKNLIKPKFD